MLIFFEFFVLKMAILGLYGIIAMVIWDVLKLPLLLEKIFSLILVFFLLSFWMLLNGLEFLPLVILLLYVGAIAVLFLFVVMILNPDFLDLLNQKQQLVSHLEKRNTNLTILLKKVFEKKATNDQKAVQKLTNEINQELQEEMIWLPKTTTQKAPVYYSYFFHTFVMGSFLGGLLSWYTFLALKFTLMASAAYKLLQVFSITFFEQLLETQLGNLLVNGVYPFSSITIQSIYNPLWAEKSELINIGLLLYTKYGIALVLVGVMLLVAMMGAIILTFRQTTLVKRQLVGAQLVRYQ